MTKTKEKKQPKVKYKEHSLLRHVRKEWKLYSFLVIPILYYVIFKYIPVIGNIIAFRRYRGGSNILGDYWVGFRYFEQFLTDPDFWQAFWNTLRLSIGYLLVRFPATLIFALLLNEMVEKDGTDGFLPASLYFSCCAVRYGERTSGF